MIRKASIKSWHGAEIWRKWESEEWGTWITIKGSGKEPRILRCLLGCILESCCFFFFFFVEHLMWNKRRPWEQMFANYFWILAPAGLMGLWWLCFAQVTLGIRQKARRAGSGVIWGTGSVSFPFWPWNICFQPSLCSWFSLSQKQTNLSQDSPWSERKQTPITSASLFPGLSPNCATV